MLEHWKSEVDKRKVFGAFLTDPLKSFDCLLLGLIIAKLSAYGSSLPALTLVQNYLSRRQQRTKINQCYSSWEELFSGVTQGSILAQFCATFYSVIFSLLSKMLILYRQPHKMIKHT